MHEAGSGDLTLEAERRAESGALAEAVQALLAGGLEAEASSIVDDWALRLLGNHQHAELQAAVATLPPRSRSLTARIASLDSRVLTGGLDTSQLQLLIDEARQQGQEGAASFGTAALVEHLLLHGDPMAIFLAVQEMSAIPSGQLPHPVALVARARLSRACAVAKLFLGPEAFQDADADRASAIADFTRAGWHVDRCLTMAAFHLVRSLVNWSASPGDRFAAIEARDQMVAAKSPQALWARYAVAITAFCHGDLAAVQAELDLIGQATNGRMPLLSLLAEHLGAMITLVLVPPGRSTDAVVARLTQIVDQVRSDAPVLIGTMLVQTTQALIETGRTQDARAWFGRVQTQPSVLAHEPHEREVMACRIDLLSRPGAPAPAQPDDPLVIAVQGRLDAALAALLELSHHQMAVGTALRSAATARRTGAHDLADELLAWAQEHSAVAKEPTWWDIRAERAARRPIAAVRQGRALRSISDLADPGSEPEPGAVLAGGRGCELRLLTPTAVLVVNGTQVRLAPALLRLVAVLAVLERPIATEQLIDLLWPDDDPIACRGRLKSAYHRLRQALAPADDLVRRDGDVWSMGSADTWRIDLWEFHRLAAGERHQRLAALRMPDGLIWQAQFPYDEALAEQRSWLEVNWLNLAQELAAAGAVSPDEIRQRAQRLGLDVAGQLSPAS